MPSTALFASAENPVRAAGPAGSVGQHSHTLPRLSRNSDAVRTITAGRLMLAAYWLLAFKIDPPPIWLVHSHVTNSLLYGYAFYSLADAAISWKRAETSRQGQIQRHVFDLAIFAALAAVTQGVASPFFLGFVFSLVCATLLFSVRGTIWTAAVAFTTYSVISLATSAGPGFIVSRFIVRAGFLAAIAALLIRLKRHEERLKNDYRKLAAWPRGSIFDLEVLTRDVLQHAQRLLRVPRVMVIWEEPGERILYIATATADGSIDITREASESGRDIVDRTARLKSFVSNAWLRSPAARSESEDGLQPLRQNPISTAFRERFAIDHVVASRFTGETVSGWLFALDKDDLTEDDLVLADITAALIEGRLEQFYLAASVRDRAVAQERVRFARDLHDGILQSLSGSALRLRCLKQTIEKDVDAALFSVAEVEQVLANDQREVRSLIARLRTTPTVEEDLHLGTRLIDLGERIQREWGLKVSLDATPLLEVLRPGMAEEVYRVVKEALTNAAVHANASRVRVEVMIRNERARIVIEDNGRGFAFAGRYDLPTLIGMKSGPVTLKERIASLGGDLIIDSRPGGGARLEIELPVTYPAAVTA